MSIARTSSIAAGLVAAVLAGCGDDASVTRPTPKVSETSETSVEFESPDLIQVSNFAGTVTVRPGEDGVMRVTVTKRAARAEDLSDIDVEILELERGLHVITTVPDGVRNTSVDLDVTVPDGVRPVLHTGVGNVRYTGRAAGQCSFATGVGDIRLELPADTDVEVHLAVGVGSASVSFPVDGTVTRTLVDGVIGSGTDGRIVAQVGTGRIVVTEYE